MTTKYLLLDTETTGLNAREHDLVEMAAIALDEHCAKQDAISPFHTLIRPRFGRKIDSRALAINHHVWCEDKGSEEYQSALCYLDAWNAFYTWLTQHYAPATWIVLVGWNVGFDEAFLREMHQSVAPSTPWPFHYHKLDLLSICRFLDMRQGISRLSYSLEKMVETFSNGQRPETMHTALTDCLMALEVLGKVEDAYHRSLYPAAPRQHAALVPEPPT